MNWTTIYITGKPGFQKEVEDELRHSDLAYMPGTSDDPGIALFWLSDAITLRTFKKAIGSKTVFKYRLHFFGSVEEFIESQNKKTTRFTKEEEALIRKMNAWQDSRQSA